MLPRSPSSFNLNSYVGVAAKGVWASGVFFFGIVPHGLAEQLAFTGIIRRSPGDKIRDAFRIQKVLSDKVSTLRLASSGISHIVWNHPSSKNI
jgi:hypothetical protein